MITSLSNQRVLDAAKLKEKKYRDSLQLFLVEGIHLLQEALKSNLVQTIFYCGTILENFDIPQNVELIECSEIVLQKLSQTKSCQGIIGVLQYKTEDSEDGKQILMLDNLQDPGNAGTLIRSSKAFGVNQVIFSEDSVDYYNDKLIRSTQGILFQISLKRKKLIEEIIRLKNKGYAIIVSTLHQHAFSLQKLPPLNNYVLILGNEGSGVSDEIMTLATYYVKIDMMNEVESLNVAIAGSIIMYEMMEKNNGK